MRVLEFVGTVGCVVLASIGQVMLRAAALGAAQSKELGLMAWVNGRTVLAIAVYLSAMLVWLWVLGRVPLTQAFAYFGLTFVLVPLLAHHWLGDPVSLSTWIGGLIILAGIVVINWQR